MARRVLTLGSPHHGTSQAALGRELAGGCPTACEQLVPDSDLLRRLNAGDETPDGPRLGDGPLHRDQVVTPVDSAALDGALNILVQDVCPRRRPATASCPAIRSPSRRWTSMLGVHAAPPLAVTCDQCRSDRCGSPTRGWRTARAVCACLERTRSDWSDPACASQDYSVAMSLEVKLAQAARLKTSR